VGLEVLDRSGGGPFDTTGTVRFNAHYIDDGVAGIMQEDSRFVRDNGQWVYVGPR
jgi:SEC-C motif-containing protein